MRTPFTLGLFVLGTVWIAGACSDSLPEPPDVSALKRSYESPTASIEPSDATQLGPAFETVSDFYEILGEEDVFSSGSIGAAETEDPETGKTPSDSFDFEGRGFLRITHVCPGWSTDAERTRDTTGAIETIVRFDATGLDGVYWGIADRCKIVADQSDVLVDGDITVVRYDAGAIFLLDGLVEVNGSKFVDDKIDYAVNETGLEYQYNLGERGNVVIKLGVNGLITVRAANGVFTCDATCEPSGGGL